MDWVTLSLIAALAQVSRNAAMKSLGHRLDDGGRIVSVVSAPEIYVNEWTSFTTKDFPENSEARDGDTVRIVMLDVADDRPVEDVLCTAEAYGTAHSRAGLAPVEIHRPLGGPNEPFEWVSETEVSPWAIYVLERSD